MERTIGTDRKGSRITPRTMPLLVMVLPFFVLVLLFSYVPLWGWVLAFFDYQPGISILESRFTGIANFRAIFVANGREFLMIMRNTLVMSLLTIITTPVPVIFAIMLTQAKSRPFQRIVQSVSSFPYFVSWIIVYSVFFALFSVGDGLLNKVLAALHVKANVDLLGNSSITWFFQNAIFLWKNTGYGAIIYLAAIAAIDPELYDAAKIDGAGTMQQIRHITVPGVAMTYSIMLVLTIGNMLSNGFDQYYIFHNPLTHDMIEVLDTYTYRIGLQRLDFSLATAVGVFKTTISVVLLVVSSSIFKRLTGASIL